MKQTKDYSGYIIENAKRSYFKEFNAASLNRDFQWENDIALKQKELAYKIKDKRDFISNCPVCKFNETQGFVSIYDYEYSECLNCGHIFLKTPPNEEAYIELYSGEETDTNSIQDEIYTIDEIFNSRLNNIAFPKVNFVEESLRLSEDVKGKWVDIGSGGGELLYAVNKRGWKGIGVESDKKLSKYSQKLGLDIISEPLNHTNVSDIITSETQVVSLINVLEHIREPQDFLKMIADNMTSRSYLLLEIPRHPSISSLSCQAFPEFTRRHIYVPDHLHIFTEKSVEILLGKQGLTPLFIWCFGQDISELFTSVILKSNIKSSELNSKIFSISGNLQKIVDENNLSDTMLILSIRE